jgi:stringent starvation protein B
MPPLPRKHAVALDLLERTSVFVHLDPRCPGVIVPQGFLKQPQLVLQIGLNMAIQIPDLDVGEEGISCTLSFNKRPHFCSLPWSSIYALIGEQGGGMVWPEDVPPEVVSQQRAAAKKETKPRKPGLRAINGSAGAQGDSADRNGSDSDHPPARRSDTPPPGSRGDGKDLRLTTPRPPRLMQLVSNPADSDSVPESQPAAELQGQQSGERAPGQQSAEQQSAGQRPEGQRPEESTRPSSASKRSRPPYLRLVD